MEAVIHESLRDVLDFHPGVLLNPRRSDDALVRDESAGALVEHREKRVEPPGDVVGIEDGDPCRFSRGRHRP